MICPILHLVTAFSHCMTNHVIDHALHHQYAWTSNLLFMYPTPIIGFVARNLHNQFTLRSMKGRSK